MSNLKRSLTAAMIVVAMAGVAQSAQAETVAVDGGITYNGNTLPNSVVWSKFWGKAMNKCRSWGHKPAKSVTLRSVRKSRDGRTGVKSWWVQSYWSCNR